MLCSAPLQDNIRLQRPRDGADLCATTTYHRVVARGPGLRRRVYVRFCNCKSHKCAVQSALARNTEGSIASLNRSAILIIPKQPYADWANSLDDGPRFAISEATDELTVFLGPDLDTVEEIERFVTKHFDYFFDYWLVGWSTDPSQWPQRRTRRMFREWFDVRIHTMVEDVVDAPYQLEDR